MFCRFCQDFLGDGDQLSAASETDSTYLFTNFTQDPKFRTLFFRDEIAFFGVCYVVYAPVHKLTQQFIDVIAVYISANLEYKISYDDADFDILGSEISYYDAHFFILGASILIGVGDNGLLTSLSDN